MKKIFGLLMIAAVVVFAAGNAMASFVVGDLIRVVDNASGADLATDLGSLTSIQSGATQLTDTLNGVSTTTYSGVSGLSTDTVYYFVYQGAANYSQIYVASTQTSGTLTVNTLKLGSGSAAADNALNGVLGYYTGVAGSSTTVYSTNASGTPGDYFNIASGPNSVGGLFTSSSPEIGASLGTTPVGMDLWSVQKTAPTSSIVSPTLILTTQFDGTNIYTTDNVQGSAAPIPPSVLLFVPGLLGLIGLKRRISA